MMSDIIKQLADVIESRKSANAETSYVAKLLNSDDDLVLKKIGEESTEVVIAAKNGDANQIVHETADLWFHTMVLLAKNELRPEDVMKALEARFGVSGLEEKANR